MEYSLCISVFLFFKFGQQEITNVSEATKWAVKWSISLCISVFLFFKFGQQEIANVSEATKWGS